MCRDSYSIKLLLEHNFSSFEAIEAATTVVSMILRIIVLYRVPRSHTNKIKKSVFWSEFSELMERISSSSEKLLLTGDFNIHMDNPSDQETKFFLKILACFGLCQHTREQTHRSDNILDLMMLQ